MRQVKISFYLIESKKNKRGEAPIYLRIKYKNQAPVNLSMEIYIKPDDWDYKKLKVKAKHHRAHSFNHQTKEMETKILKIYDALIYNGEPISLIEIKNVLRNKVQQKTLLALIDYSIKSIESDPKYSKGRIQNYRSFKKKITKFLNAELSRNDLELGHINYEIITQFDAFLSKEYRNRINTIKANMNTFKAIINRGRKINWLNDNPFKNYRCKSEPSNRQFLTIEEVSKIQNLDFSQPKHLSTALSRDLFLFMTYTGITYGDMIRLKESHIAVVNGQRFIQIEREKTNGSCIIPLLPKSEELIKEYKDHPISKNNGTLLPYVPIRCINKNLKIIARMAEISKKLSCHIGRHTFATLSLDYGVPIETLSRALGHSSIKTTRIYGKVTESKINNDYKGLRSVF